MSYEICVLPLACLEITKETRKVERKGTVRKEIKWTRQKNGDKK